MRWTHLPFLFGFAVMPLAGASGQAPVVTWAGDPSVDDDSIYALVVDPHDWSGEDWVYLLDDGIVRFDEQGHSVRTYRQVIQILTIDGARKWGELQRSYDAALQRLTYNWIKVLDLEGNLLTEGARYEQEEGALASQFAPVYSDLTIRRMSLGGVRPGTILDFSCTVEEFDLVMPGDFVAGWWITTGALTRRSRLLVDLPVDLPVHLHERNLSFERQDDTIGDRRVLTWATEEIEPLEIEPYTGPLNDIFEEVWVSSAVSWGDVVGWAHDLFSGRAHVSPSVREAAAPQLQDAQTRRDSVLALHRWVAQDFRYVSLSTGVGGHQPRAPGDVVASGFGDCKDKTTLFITLLRAIGITADPVLVNSRQFVDSAMATSSAFNHVIASVTLDDSVYYVDLTSPLAPFGTPLAYLANDLGLVIHEDGTGGLVRFPREKPESAGSRYRLVGEVFADGSLRARLTSEMYGSRQLQMREMLAGMGELTPTERERVLQRFVGGVLEGSSGDSLDITDGYDLAVLPHIAATLYAPDAIQVAGTALILPLPLPRYATLAGVQELEAWGPRRFPFDVEQVTGGVHGYATAEFTLPEGWRAELPPDIELGGAFGSYRSRYVQIGRQLRIEREFIGGSGIEPPERFPELLAWFRLIAEDDITLVALTPATQVVGRAKPGRPRD